MIALGRLVTLGIILGLWWLAAHAGSALIPTPFATAQAAVAMARDGRLWKATLESLEVYAAGLGLAVAVGIAAGLLMGGFRLLGETLELYLHGFVLADDGPWVVVQQGMNDRTRTARRYHWRSAGLASFVDAPHAAIDGPNAGEIVNLTDARAAGSPRARAGRRAPPSCRIS